VTSAAITRYAPDRTRVGGAKATGADPDWSCSVATVRGAPLDGDVAAGMGLSFAVQTLTGRESWFCVEDTVICLGAGIQVDRTASVVTRRHNGTLGVAVGDPTRQRTGAGTVTVDGAVSGVTSTDPGVTVLAVLATTPNLLGGRRGSGRKDLRRTMHRMTARESGPGGRLSA
jgi:hypothetical protein